MNREVAGGLVFGEAFLFSLLSRTFTNKVTEGVRDLTGDWLLTTDGGDYDRLRRILQPAFSRRHIEIYSEMIVEYTRKATENWRPGVEVDLAHEMQSLVLRVIVKFLINSDMLKEETSIVEMVHNKTSHPIGIIEGLLNLSPDLPFIPSGKRKAAIRTCDEFFYALIDVLVQIIKDCSRDNRNVRVVGSGHSFTPLVETNDVLLSLEHIQGIIVKVKLCVVPAKRLHFKSHRERLSAGLTNLERYNQENSHFEFFWFPYTRWVQTKFLNETEVPVSKSSLWENFNNVVLENGIYWLLSECCRLLPLLSRTISTISTMAIAPVNVVNYSHRLYAAPRMVHLQAMEYAIPMEHVQTALREIQVCINRHRFSVHFPLGCRFVHADDIWLSPAYQRESAYIAVYMYQGMEYKAYFQYVAEILQRYNGRPHWGKIHSQDATMLAPLYPRWHDFRRIRATLDPQGLFLNDYLRQLFDVDGPMPSDVIPIGVSLLQAEVKLYSPERDDIHHRLNGRQ